MFVMSECEKYEQVGRLAEEYSHLKGELNHVIEKLNRANLACLKVTQSYNVNNDNLRVQDGKLWSAVPGQQPYGGSELSGLLNTREFIEVLEHRDRLRKELTEKTNRLRELAPHLL